MVPAAIVFLLLPVVLLSLGSVVVARAVAALRSDARGTAASLLRLTAGLGTIGAAVLAISAVWSSMQYGILVLPVAAVLLALVLDIVLLGLAELLDHRRARRRADPGSGV